MIRRDVTGGKPLDRILSTFLPDLLELYAVNLLENVDAYRWNADTDDGVGLLEVFRADLGQWSAEIGQRRVNSKCVWLSSLDEDVQVFRDPWLRVNADSVATHNDILNFAYVQGALEFF